RHMIDRQTLQPVEPVIRLAVEMEHIHFRFHEVDKRQEAMPVEPAFIKPVRGAVRSRDDYDTALEQMLEQTAKDRRICNVMHLKLIKAEKRRLLRNHVGHGRDRVRALHLPGLFLLPPIEDALMRLLHEGMKMDAALRRDGDRIEEEVHQHGLATPNTAPDIEPLRRRHGPPETEARERPDLLTGPPV